MRKLFDAADQYIEQSDWKTLAASKFCLCSIGILIGCQVPKKARKPVMLGAGAVFLVTYIPLIKKLADILLQKDE